MNFVDCNNSGGVSSDNEPTWRICRKAVWMSIRNYNNLADVENVLNRQDDGHDLHIASAKCFVQLLVNVICILNIDTLINQQNELLHSHKSPMKNKKKT